MGGAAQAREGSFVPVLAVDRVEMWNGGIAVLLKPCDDGTPAHPSGVPLGARLQSTLGASAQSQPWHFTLGYCPQRDSYDVLAASDARRLETQRASVEAAVKAALPGLVPMGEARLC